MKRTLLLAGLGIAVLTGGSLTFVALLDGEPPAAASPLAPGAATPPPTPGAPPTEPPRFAARRRAAGTERARRDAPGEDPSANPMADRVTRKAVRKALQAAPIQARLARCVDRDVGFGGDASTGHTPRARPAVLVLELETLGDRQVRVAGAQVQSFGGASEETVSCARSVLRGQVIATPAVQRRERMRMPFPLSPRREVLASSR